MPVDNVLVLSDLDPILARLDAIELRLNGEPPPPPPPPSGDLDLGDVVIEAGQTWPPAGVTTIRLRSLHCKLGSTFRVTDSVTIITKDEPGAGRIQLDGTVDIEGSAKTPFVRLADDALAGQTVLAQHGVCFAGEIAPADAVEVTGIRGLVK